MADNKIEKCPYCKGECRTMVCGYKGEYYVLCKGCCYESAICSNEAEAIAAHNRVSRNNAIADELGKALESFVTDYDEGFPAGDNMQANLPTARAAIAKWKGEKP